MDFELSDTQLIFRTMARDFAEREVKPVAMELDRRSDPKDCLPLDLIKKGLEQEFHKMVIPEKYGGLGLDGLTSCMMLEELAAADSGYAIAWHVNNIGLTFMMNMGSEEQGERFCKPLLGPEGGITGLSTTEPSGGVTSAQIIAPTEFVYSTTARLDGDEWVLNGEKCFASNGGLPDTKWMLCFCRTDMSKIGFASMGAFVIPTDAPGYKLVGEEDKMGHRLANSQTIKFEDCRIPRGNLLGGGKRTITYDHDSAVASIALGCARTAYESAVQWARERVVLGKPIIKYQLIQQKIADMFIALETSRCLIWRVASYADTHAVMDNKLARTVKVFCTEAANRVCYDAMQIVGGAGYSKGTWVEKCYRDVRVATIYEGTNEALRLSLAQLIEAEG